MRAGFRRGPPGVASPGGARITWRTAVRVKEPSRDGASGAPRLAAGRESQEKPAQKRATFRRRREGEQPVGRGPESSDPGRRTTRAIRRRERCLGLALLAEVHKPSPQGRVGGPFRIAGAGSALDALVDWLAVVVLRGRDCARVARHGLRLGTAVAAAVRGERRLQRPRKDHRHDGDHRYKAAEISHAPRHLLASLRTVLVGASAGGR